jgi:fructokinase
MSNGVDKGMKETPGRTSRPVIFGEVLFDRFPDGSRVLGGAPFNVAWHLQGLGAAPLLISRIGDDEAGHTVRNAMTRWGMDLTGLGVDPTYPTGAVDVRFSGHQHTFDILADQAYDHISQDQLAGAVSNLKSLFYQGTLSTRSQHVRELLTDLLAPPDPPLFVDLNLRNPWWRSSDLPPLLRRARWVKMNDVELNIVSRELGYSNGNLETLARKVQQATQIQLLIITLGERGAFALQSGSEPITVEPKPVDGVVDTVGAGDSFAAVVILGLLRDWPLELTMRRAQQFASQIVQQRGATSFDRKLYAQVLQE